jgi:hypothetical protein
VLVMGDLVPTESEINPVMSKLLESGIEITAVHNHLLRTSPATYYMHIHGRGDPVAMATAIRAAHRYGIAIIAAIARYRDMGFSFLMVLTVPSLARRNKLLAKKFYPR